MTTEDSLREAALAWFKNTASDPNRKMPEEQIVELYKKTRSYAETDSLLAEFYAANHLHL